MTPDRWEYLKNLQPSPGTWFLYHTHPNRQQRKGAAAKLGEKNEPDKNPVKAEKRRMVKHYGFRQYQKKIKAFRRFVADGDDMLEGLRD